MSASAIMVSCNGVAVPLECHPSHPGLDLERCKNAKPFVDWLAGLDSGLKVSKIVLHDIDFFGPRVGFLKLEAVTKCNGEPVPGIIFMRGGAVSILVRLLCEGVWYIVGARQARVPVGKENLLELPAGMIDDAGDPVGVGVKELAEETGIVLKKKDLVDLTALAYEQSGPDVHEDEVLAAPIRNKSTPLRGMYPSAGGSDEFLRLYLHEREVTRAELDAMQGKATGCLEEGEKIVMEIIRADLFWRVCSDAKALSSLLLFQNLRAAGQI